MGYFYSNEIVFQGHPDKVCDQIADALLVATLQETPSAHCGYEVMGTAISVVVAGESSNPLLPEDTANIVNDVLDGIGYPTYEVCYAVNTQSADINQGVETGGAGDQGMMFGYACDETEQMLPLAQVILQRLAIAYAVIQNAEPSTYFPDGKAQITGYYVNGRLKYIEDFTISYSNSEEERDVTDTIIKTIASNICASYDIEVRKFHINPTGRFNIWGFEADAGLTGRKIVCDSYHSFAPVGGGAFSGKDPTKVDRSGAYYARWLAKRILKRMKDKVWRNETDVRHEVTVQLSYSIGMEEPMAIQISIDKDNMSIMYLAELGVFTVDEINEMKEGAKPNNIIEKFDLRHFDYTQTSQFGHFGFIEFPWEAID